MLNVHWPLFDLRLRTSRLELRLPKDEDLFQLADVAAAGIHDPAVMPFAVPWTDAPPGLLERSILQYHWGRRAALGPSDWDLSFGVWSHGQLVGMQTVAAKGFGEHGTVETGSWLGRPFQRRGIGLEMRAAVLHLAFDGLGASAATSGAFAHNIASRRISERLGYLLESEGIQSPRGIPRPHQRFRLDRPTWAVGPRLDVSIEGLDRCRTMLIDSAPGGRPDVR